jgi:hypothetical protein
MVLPAGMLGISGVNADGRDGLAGDLCDRAWLTVTAARSRSGDIPAGQGWTTAFQGVAGGSQHAGGPVPEAPLCSLAD